MPNHGPVARGDRGLAREQVVDGLDHEYVDATLEQREGELLVARREVVVTDLAERGELGARSDGAGDEARTVGARVTVCDASRDHGRRVG